MKKFLFLFYVLFAAVSGWAHDFEVNGIYYRITSSRDWTVAVTYKGSSWNYTNYDYPTNLTIPETVTYDRNTWRVTSIDSRACYSTSVSSITIPESIVSIGKEAFHETSWYNNQPNGLVYVGNFAYTYKGTMPESTSIVLRNGTKGIAAGAFANCSGMVSVAMPESMAYVGSDAFDNCSGLVWAEFASIESLLKIYFECSSYISYMPKSNPLCYIDRLYIGGKEVTDIVIPESVTSVGQCVFSGWKGLASVTIPESVTSIGPAAFYGCTGLTSISIPKSVTSIGKYAFYGCTNLEEVEYASLESLCGIDFSDLDTESPRTNGNPLNMGGRLIIDGKEVKDIVIPESVSSINPGAFQNCSSLTSVTIPEDVTSIGNYAFFGCKLRNVLVKSSTPPLVGRYDVFSNMTCYHTTLYVPTDTWDAYAYDDSWYKFINIRETAMTSSEVTAEKAYTLMNAKDFTYAVYDPVNDCLGTVSSIGVDENNPNHCWQVMEVDGKQFLYNIGAKKFAVPSMDGSGFTLSESIGSVTITEGENGMIINNHSETPWAMVVNERMGTDDSVEGIVVTAIEDIKVNNANDSQIYDLSGRKVTKPTKGAYIKDGKKVLIQH